MTAESLPLVTPRSMNRNTVGTFLNMQEEVAAESNLSDSCGNIFSIDDSGVQISDKPDCNNRKGV